MKSKMGIFKICRNIGGYSMKEKYAEPIVKIISFSQDDIVTTSPGQGDNLLDDGYFD